MTPLRTPSTRVRRPSFRLRCEALEERLALATYWVNNIGDSGLGSLRLAIQADNDNPGPDDIRFNIPGAGVHTIQPLSQLPWISDALTIDGYTQPGTSPNSLAVGNNAVLRIELNGSLLGTLNDYGLSAFTALTVRGLVINRFGGTGIYAIIAGPGSLQVLGNFIGTDPSGTAALGNGGNGLRSAASLENSCMIGSPSPGDRNVISGNHGSGISAMGCTIQGNYVGTNAQGTAALPNGDYGIYVSRYCPCLVGGTEPGAGNLVSGNGSTGIYWEGYRAPVIQGNRIGTNAAGTAPIPNMGHGVHINPGDAPGDGARIENNLISGNVGSGVWLEYTQNALVYSNFIGTNAAGTAPLPNIHGITINRGSNNRVGRDLWGNLISGNRGDGILLTGGTRDNSVAFNRIGVRATATYPGLGNEGHGIHVLDASNTIIGANTIAYSGYGPSGQSTEPKDGVHVRRGTGNDLRGNAIFTNRRLGINLLSTPEPTSGVTANDFQDPDTGPNQLQNFPELTSATASGGTLAISGHINTNPSALVRVEFFVSNQCDASGHGEGTIFVGDYSHTTSATTGSLTFLDLRFISSEKSGFVTATATNTSRGDTSEFSACVPITAGAGPGGGGGGGDAAALLDAATGPTPFPPPTPPRPAGATLAAALTEPERRAVPVGAEPPRRAAAPRAEAEARDAVFAAPLPTLNVELL